MPDHIHASPSNFHQILSLCGKCLTQWKQLILRASETRKDIVRFEIILNTAAKTFLFNIIKLQK